MDRPSTESPQVRAVREYADATFAPLRAEMRAESARLAAADISERPQFARHLSEPTEPRPLHWGTKVLLGAAAAGTIVGLGIADAKWGLVSETPAQRTRSHILDTFQAMDSVAVAEEFGDAAVQEQLEQLCSMVSGTVYVNYIAPELNVEPSCDPPSASSAIAPMIYQTSTPVVSDADSAVGYECVTVTPDLNLPVPGRPIGIPEAFRARVGTDDGMVRVVELDKLKGAEADAVCDDSGDTRDSAASDPLLNSDLPKS